MNIITHDLYEHAHMSMCMNTKSKKLTKERSLSQLYPELEQVLAPTAPPPKFLFFPSHPAKTESATPTNTATTDPS